MSSYIVITPVRNEEQHIGKTIESMVAQTVLPAAWVIVDDGSTDRTGSILDGAAKRHSWIKVIHRPDRGFRKSGGGVIEALYDGLNLLSSLDYAVLAVDNRPPSTDHRPQSSAPWSFLVKFDGDLLFHPDYFQKCFEKFESDPKLGLGGGMICKESAGEWVEEAKGDPPFHVRGATKIYRQECWEALGGLIKAPGWDTLDELKANMLGWRTYTFRDLKVLQLKSTGIADGTWKNWVKNGRANYITGYHPLFMVEKCVSRFREKPYGIVTAGLLYGFFSSYVNGTQRVPDDDLVKYLRNQQIRRLSGKVSLWSKPTVPPCSVK